MEDNAPRPDDTAATPYEAPNIEARTSSRDPLVWIVSSPICL